MNLESINAIPATPEYKEDRELNEMLRFADVDQYDDETLTLAESQAPGFILRRAAKLVNLPVLSNEDINHTAINKFVSNDEKNTAVTKKLYQSELKKPLTMDGQVETPADIKLFIEDLCNIMPRIFKAEGTEMVTKFNPERIIFVDSDTYAKLNGESADGRKKGTGGGFFNQFNQMVVVDAQLLSRPAGLTHVIFHEMVHVLSFNSQTINNIDFDKKKIDIDNRRSGIRTTVNKEGVLLALNECMTEGLAKKIVAEYADIFPYVVNAVDKEMDDLIEYNKDFESKIGQPTAVRLVPFETVSGFETKWQTIRDVSSSKYAMYIAKYDAYLSEVALRNGKTPADIKNDLLPKLKEAYINGRMLPFFRACSGYGISVDDLMKKDKQIIEETKQEFRNTKE